MPKPEFTLKFIKDGDALEPLSETLMGLPAFALDIETTDWWNRHRERIALIQIAFRAGNGIKVFIIDALAQLDLSWLRRPLEDSSVVKIIHNASFDATRLNKHYGYLINGVFDTMLAARRSGERKYSLQAQAEVHLGLHLDKSARSSDWSRRPLDNQQLYYAALDPYTTLLLYENQTGRRLDGSYRLKPVPGTTQNLLPLEELTTPVEPAGGALLPVVRDSFSPARELPDEVIALLGIITELPTRYSPDSIAVSVGAERAGLAGWIIDRRLGKGAEPDEESVKLAIARLCDNGFIRITETRRLEATETGKLLWTAKKNGGDGIF